MAPGPTLEMAEVDPGTASRDDVRKPSLSPPPLQDQCDQINTAAASLTNGRRKKRPAVDHSEGPHKVAKRRAARACVSCRARKVRCDVIEGAPCGNCRWDKVECIIQESRRRRKNHITANLEAQNGSAEAQLLCKGPSVEEPVMGATNLPCSRGDPRIPSFANASAEIRNHDDAHYSDGSQSSDYDDHGNAGGMMSLGGIGADGHPPLTFYQSFGHHHDASNGQDHHCSPSWTVHPSLSQPGLGDASNIIGTRLSSLDNPASFVQLPPFVRPIPSKIAPEDVAYLRAKGALSIPCATLQNALLCAYIEFVHPYMPLLDLQPLLRIINSYDGSDGQISLFLYHAVMFSATAFVDMRHLREAGFLTRKAARKAYFLKTRLLYDFDYEMDRLVLIQGLMLMTYWYETPDDQKDTWHWMGVAISLAHTIGLHRNPEMTGMAPASQKLWKRIWWSCFMRDRLVALGMRRPTRIKDEDFDVPMLVESDFEIQALPDHIAIISPKCTLMRDVEMQRELAAMCVQKAKLCLCISDMLKTQYSVLIREHIRPESTTNSTMMLFPNKQLDNLDSVKMVDAGLKAWAEALPACCQYQPLLAGDAHNGRSTLAVQRTLLHMTYYTTVSALHRPQFLRSSPRQAPVPSRQVQDMSRHLVKDAATHLTSMATELHKLRLDRYLPTTGVTVILPALIIHLLEMKSPMADARAKATRGFRQCMRVMGKLRECYSSADFAIVFLHAALRKAGIDINANIEPSTLAIMERVPSILGAQTTPPPDSSPYVTASDVLFSKDAEPKEAEAERPMGWQPLTNDAAGLDMSTAHSPPHTDVGSADLTPGATLDAEGHGIEMDLSDMGFAQDPDGVDWNAIAGTDLDLDQWLQFPPDGLDGTDEDKAEHALAWGSM